MPELQPAQELSKLVFGRNDCLTTWYGVMQYSIEPPQLFSATDLYWQLGDYTNSMPNRGTVGQECRRLSALGAITIAPLEAYDEDKFAEMQQTHKRYFCRQPHELWPFVQELANRTVELSTIILAGEQ